jgi:hypothetical protein
VLSLGRAMHLHPTGTLGLPLGLLPFRIAGGPRDNTPSVTLDAVASLERERCDGNVDVALRGEHAFCRQN